MMGKFCLVLVNFKCKCLALTATVQGASLGSLVAFVGAKGSFTAERCQNRPVSKIAGCPLKEVENADPKNGNIFNQWVHRKVVIVPSAEGLAG